METSHTQRKTIWGLMVIAVVVASLLPQEQIPVKITFSDKIVHFLSYFILSFFALLSSRQKHSLLSILALQVLIGIGVEVAQSFVPGRTPELLDILANSLGVILGALVYFLYRKIKPIDQN